MIGKCKNCGNRKTYTLASGRNVDFCKAGRWEREDLDQDGIRDDYDFHRYINKDRFCDDYIDL